MENEKNSPEKSIEKSMEDSSQAALAELSRKDPSSIDSNKAELQKEETSPAQSDSEPERENQEGSREEDLSDPLMNQSKESDLNPPADFNSFGSYQQALQEQKESILQSIDSLPPEKRAIYDRDIAQMKELIKRNRLSNYILLLLIVLYLILLFFLNNWILLAFVCVAMVGLVIWDHFSLKKLKALRNEISELGVLPTPTSQQAISNKPITNLNNLPKEYTVLDEVDINGTYAEHIVLSTHGVMVISKTDLAEQVAEILAIESSKVFWIDDLYPLEKQVEMILDRQDTLFTEQEVMQQAYTLNRLAG